MTTALLIGGTLLLAWSNGTNDNFKGVATLYGSGVLGYRAALLWASVATLAGGLCSVLLAGQLVQTFNGAAILHGGALDPSMLAALLAAAGVTVLIASLLGMPTSTTHALMGALLGVVLVVSPARIRIDRFGALFLGPMLLSPLIAIVLAGSIFVAVRWVRRRIAVPDDATDAVSTRVRTQHEALYAQRGFLRMDARSTTTCAHVLSAGAVCFARALNDTPKIAAVVLTTGAVTSLGHSNTLAVVAAIVVLGGLIQGQRVARTMSRQITPLNAESGLVANVVTASLVMWASRLGLPVSTTHVSCASIFGIAAAKRQGNRGTITKIVTTWVTTLPFAAALGAGAYLLLRGV